MKWGATRINRALKFSSRRQRLTALFAAAACAVLLIAAIALVIVTRTGILQPTPTNEAQMRYVLALEAERVATADAKQRGADLDTDPALVTARVDLARARLALGQLSQASSTATRLIAANPDHIQVVQLHANILEQRGRSADALAAYQHLLELTSESEPSIYRDAWRGIGHALLDQGDKSAALDALERAAAVPPETPWLYIEAGDIAYSLELWQRAAENYYRARLFDTDVNALSEKLRDLEQNHPAEVKAAREALDASFQTNGTTPHTGSSQ